MPVPGLPAYASGAQRTRLDFASMRAWPLRRWYVTAAVAGFAALVVGVPTGIVSNDFFTRMTPVTWWDYPIWAVSALLAGLIAATYVRVGGISTAAADLSRRTVGATLLTTFAVGCPICNKLVVALIGVSGATSYWAPLQPVLGVVSIGLLVTGLVVRLRGSVACPMPTAR